MLRGSQIAPPSLQQAEENLAKAEESLKVAQEDLRRAQQESFVTITPESARDLSKDELVDLVQNLRNRLAVKEHKEIKVQIDAEKGSFRLHSCSFHGSLESNTKCMST